MLEAPEDFQTEIKAYTNDFQPGSPNDYKMRHFQRWMREKFENAELDLLFWETVEYKHHESDVVKLGFFLNDWMRGSKDGLLEAHWEFYRRSFDNRPLAPGDEQDLVRPRHVGVDARAP